MTDRCAEHRPYLGALADGEADLVPAATRHHAAACPECAAEVEAHRLVTRRLWTGLTVATSCGRPTAPRTRVRAGVVAALGAVACAGLGVAGWSVTHRSVDGVGVAVEASHRTAEIRSADATAIALWCSRSSDRRPPPVSLAGLRPDGARMDAEGAAAVVTVFYRTEDGGRVSVGWTSTEPSPPGREAIETRQESGATVLIVRAPAGSAVLSGDVPMAQLWRVAGIVEATSD